MQKVINVLALLSFGVSTAIVAGGVYVYTQKDAIVEGVKEEAMSQIGDMIGDAIGDAAGGAVGGLLGGSSDGDAPTSPVPIPVIPFWGVVA